MAAFGPDIDYIVLMEQLGLNLEVLIVVHVRRPKWDPIPDRIVGSGNRFRDEIDAGTKAQRQVPNITGGNRHRLARL